MVVYAIPFADFMELFDQRFFAVIDRYFKPFWTSDVMAGLTY